MFLVWSTVTSGLILLLVMSRVPPANFYSLNVNFTVTSQRTHQQPWCAAQGSVDTQPFMHYNRGSNKATPLGPLGKKVQNTAKWADMTQTLKDVCQHLREFQDDPTLEKRPTRGRPTVQASVSCHLGAGERTDASWEVSINGQKILSIDTTRGNCTATDPGMKLKKTWENYPELRKSFQTISMGDCTDWLRDFLESWKEMLEPTAPPSENSSTLIPPSSAASFVGNFPRIIILLIISSVLRRQLL